MPQDQSLQPDMVQCAIGYSAARRALDTTSRQANTTPANPRALKKINPATLPL
jgi:hypothetical protein